MLRSKPPSFYHEPRTKRSPRTKRTKRALTAEEKKQLKNFAMAYIIHRTRNNSPTNYNIWDKFHPKLKKGFDKVLDLYNDGKADEVARILVKNVAERKWLELSLQLISNGMDQWDLIRDAMRTGLENTTSAKTDIIAESILHEGNIRGHVLKHLSESDYRMIRGKKKMTDEQKLDIIQQINDPTSKMHKDILRALSFTTAKELIRKFESLKVTRPDGSVVTVDCNTHAKGGETLLYNALSSIYTGGGYSNMLTMVRYLLENNADPTIPIHRTGSEKGTISTPLAKALDRCTHAPEYWSIVQMILAKRPLRDFYIKGATPNTYAVRYWEGKLLETIDNVWILKNLPLPYVEWLIQKGGLDLFATSDGHVNVKVSIREQEEDVRKHCEKLTAEAEINRQSLIETSAKLVELKNIYEAVEKVVIKQERDLQKAQTKLEELQTVQSRANELFTKHRIFLGGQKSKSRRRA